MNKTCFFSAIRCIHICHMWYYKFQRARYSPSYALSFVDQQWALNGHLVACTLVTMCTKGDISTYFHHKMSRGESNGTVHRFLVLLSKTGGRFSGPCWRFKMWFQKLQLQVFHPQESWGTTWKVVPGSIPFRGRRKKKQFAGHSAYVTSNISPGQGAGDAFANENMGVVWNCHFRDTACAMDQTIFVLWISVVFMLRFW